MLSPGRLDLTCLRSLTFLCLRGSRGVNSIGRGLCMDYRVAVKELKLSYHNGYI